MGTRHDVVWQASLEGIDWVEPPARLRLRKALRERDRGTRADAAVYVLECYEQAGIIIPASLEQRDAA
jgi:hypothetical protein